MPLLATKLKLSCLIIRPRFVLHWPRYHFLTLFKTFSINPQSLWYSKDSEGLDYHDTSGLTSAQRGVVPPGQQHTYNWYVPSWSGPSSADQSSIVWSYSSAVNLYTDPHAGLVGPIIITAPAYATSAADPTPTDVDRELVVLAMMVNENLSPFYAKTLSNLGINPFVVDPFGNWMFSLNGRCFGNLDGLTASTGGKVTFIFVVLIFFVDRKCIQTRVYLISMGNIDGGPHAIHPHSFSFSVTNVSRLVCYGEVSLLSFLRRLLRMWSSYSPQCREPLILLLIIPEIGFSIAIQQPTRIEVGHDVFYSRLLNPHPFI